MKNNNVKLAIIFIMTIIIKPLSSSLIVFNRPSGVDCQILITIELQFIIIMNLYITRIFPTDTML